MLPVFKLRVAFEQLKKDVLSDIVGVSAITQIRQCDPKHDITVVFNRLSKSLFFHNHLPVTLMVLDEVLTIDTLWPNEMFQIQAGKTYQNKPVPFWQKESPSVRGGRFPERAARCLSLLLYSPAQDGKSGQRYSSKKTRSPVGRRVFGRAVNVLGNYSSSLSLASSASSVSTSWLSSSSREAMSSLIAPLAGAFLSSIGAPRSSSSASA